MGTSLFELGWASVPNRFCTAAETIIKTRSTHAILKKEE